MFIIYAHNSNITNSDICVIFLWIFTEYVRSTKGIKEVLNYFKSSEDYWNNLPKTVKLRDESVAAASPNNSANTTTVFIVAVDVQQSAKHAWLLLLIYTS